MHSINKNSMNHESWQYTRLDTIHDELHAFVVLEEGELPIVSSYVTSDQWYLMTSRQVWSCLAGQVERAAGASITNSVTGNFKGFGAQKLERMTLKLREGGELDLDFETGFASMAPIYYARSEF